MIFFKMTLNDVTQFCTSFEPLIVTFFSAKTLILSSQNPSFLPLRPPLKLVFSNLFFCKKITSISLHVNHLLILVHRFPFKFRLRPNSSSIFGWKYSLIYALSGSLARFVFTPHMVLDLQNDLAYRIILVNS